MDLCFDVPRHCCSRDPVEVVVSEADLVKGWQKNGNKALLAADLSRVVPTSVKIVGSTLPPQSPYALQLHDANGIPLYETHVAHYSSGSERDCYGFPLYMDDKTMFRNNGIIDDHVRDYANISVETIKDGCLSLQYPNGGHEFALVPKDKAMYFVWVLEVKNGGKDNILENIAYQDPNHPEYIRLFKRDFDRCIDYYKNALSHIHFCNMSKMKARLVPRDHYVPGSEQTRRETIVLEVTGRATELNADAVNSRMSGMKVSAANAGRASAKQMDLGRLTEKFAK